MRLSRRRLMLAAGAAAARFGMGAGRAQTAAPATPLALEARSTPLRLPGASADAPVASFDGSLAGPVVRLIQGQALALRLTNRLDEPFSLQWHGMRAPNGVDGDWPLAGTMLAPGATQTIGFTPPDSGLTWFHPAALPGRPDLTARGLRGVLLVEEAAPPFADRDVLLVLADWPAADGRPATLTVNGAQAPERARLAQGARLRLRIVNASTTRAMILGLDGARPLILAIDGQPSDLFEPLADRVPVGPGARFEFMIDLPREPGPPLRLMLHDGGDVRSLFECETDGPARAPLAPIAALPRNPALSRQIPLERSVRADLRIAPGPTAATPWTLNGAAAADLPAAPLLKARAGEPVTLGLDNRTAGIVPLRVHGHVMRLLHAKDDGWEPYWRDSVILTPASVTHVAFVADNPGRWLIESALADQAAGGLRTWFEVA